jgi:hypothetical protein
MKFKNTAAALLSMALIAAGTANAFAEGNVSVQKSITRAEAVEMLWRFEGQPETNYDMHFEDVSGDYVEAIQWAAGQNIVSGYGNGVFAPDETVSNEQFMAMLYRYAISKDYDVSVGESANILSYNDAFDISEYAVPAFQWAFGMAVAADESGSIMPKAVVTAKAAEEMIEKTAQLYEERVVAQAADENITLTYMGGNNFMLASGDKSEKIKFNCLVDEGHEPEIELADINGDGKEEICIKLVVGTGSSFHLEGMAVYDKETLEEYFVPDPCEIIETAVSYDESGEKCTVAADGKIYEIDDMGSYGSIVFSDNVKYNIKDGVLTAEALLQNAPDGICGKMIIEYKAAEMGFVLGSMTYIPEE